MPVTHLQIPDNRNRQCPHSDISDDIQRIESHHELESINAMTAFNGDIPILRNGPAAENESDRLCKMVCCDYEAEKEDGYAVAFNCAYDSKDEEDDGETDAEGGEGVDYLD